MSNAYDILIRPVLTEKSTELMDDENKVVFRVRRDATKPQIRDAVERLFGVDVDKVNTLVMPGKPRRFGRYVGQRAGYKKAVVKIASDQTLDLFALEGTEDHGVV